MFFAKEIEFFAKEMVFFAKDLIFFAKKMNFISTKIPVNDSKTSPFALMAPIFFASAVDFRKWLAANHKTADELVVGFWKVATGKPSMTWSGSVDEALCFGWIDGVRRRVDEESYTIRFTPRRPDSVWSAINIAKVEKLNGAGLMMPAGIAAFEKRTAARSSIYAYENDPGELDPIFEKQFKDNERAWAFFESQAPWYRRQKIYWVESAKQEATRQKRMAKLIAASQDVKRL